MKLLNTQMIDQLLQNPNIQTALGLIGHTEGTDKRYGYNTLVGGKKFNDYSHHPNIVGLVTKEGPSTAAGRYQIVYSTWQEYAPKYGLKDFSPLNQDRMAVILMNRRGALEPLLKGEFGKAINKLGDEWASLPSSNYSQHKVTWAEVNNVLNKNYKANMAKYRLANNPYSLSNSLRNTLASYTPYTPSIAKALDIDSLYDLINTQYHSIPSKTIPSKANAVMQAPLAKGLSIEPQYIIPEKSPIQNPILPKFNRLTTISYNTPNDILKENNPYLDLAYSNALNGS